ncbi:MAG: TetR/AcrR family transcriptional regulator [Actinobacteria bacterium]|nr:TetR/AcrR family transcriptional regulator [Actinomycetota bacterium]
MSATTRQTADERRETVLGVAAGEFARKGLHGASTDAIARAAGISQPYLFRLFKTKKELYLATSARKMEETYQTFERASRGKTGQEALAAMGAVYTELIEDRERLQLMLQCFAACDDVEVRASVRGVWRDLVELIERVSGEPPEAVSAFFAKGMLLNVVSAMQLFEDPTAWGDRLIAGCKPELEMPVVQE